MTRNKLLLSTCAAMLLCFAPQHAQAEGAKRKAVRQLLDLSGASKIGDQILDQMIGTFRQSFSMPNNYWTKLRKRMNTRELIDKIVPIYERHFTLGDIKALISFYRSPIGRKFVRVQPKLLAESMQVGQQWGRKTAQKVMRELKGKKK